MDNFQGAGVGLKCANGIFEYFNPGPRDWNTKVTLEINEDTPLH